MKKVLRLLLALILAFSLAGCGGDGGGNETPEAQTTAPSAKAELLPCTGAHTGETTWLPWGKGEGEDRTLPDGGCYYLEKNVDLSGVTAEIRHDTAICLNGKAITGDIPVRVRAALMISDHTAKTKSGVYKAGSVVLNVDHPCTDTLFVNEEGGKVDFAEGINTNSDMENEVNLYKPTEEEAAVRKLDIYIIAGQSNASGSSTVDNVTPEEQDRNRYKNVRYYGYRVNVTGKIVQNEVGLKPVQQGLGSNANTIGPELGMARYLDPLYPTSDHKAILLKVAAGGTSLLKTQNADGTLAGNYAESSATRFYERGSWTPEVLQKNEVKALGENRATGFLARELKRNAQDLYEKLLKAGYRPENIRFISVSWMQGEDDRAHCEEYALAMKYFLEEVRSAISGFTGEDYSKLPFVIGEVSRSFGSTPSLENNLKNAKFIAMQDALPDRYPAITVIPSGQIDMVRATDDGYEFIAPDGMHWHYRDMLKVGELFAEASLHPENFEHTNLKQ